MYRNVSCCYLVRRFRKIKNVYNRKVTEFGYPVHKRTNPVFCTLNSNGVDILKISSRLFNGHKKS